MDKNKSIKRIGRKHGRQVSKTRTSEHTHRRTLPKLLLPANRLK